MKWMIPPGALLALCLAMPLEAQSLSSLHRDAPPKRPAGFAASRFGDALGSITLGGTPYALVGAPSENRIYFYRALDVVSSSGSAGQVSGSSASFEALPPDLVLEPTLATGVPADLADFGASFGLIDLDDGDSELDLVVGAPSSGPPGQSRRGTIFFFRATVLAAALASPSTTPRSVQALTSIDGNPGDELGFQITEIPGGEAFISRPGGGLSGAGQVTRYGGVSSLVTSRGTIDIAGQSMNLGGAPIRFGHAIATAEARLRTGPGPLSLVLLVGAPGADRAGSAGCPDDIDAGSVQAFEIPSTGSSNFLSEFIGPCDSRAGQALSVSPDLTNDGLGVLVAVGAPRAGIQDPSSPCPNPLSQPGAIYVRSILDLAQLVAPPIFGSGDDDRMGDAVAILSQASNRDELFLLAGAPQSQTGRPGYVAKYCVAITASSPFASEVFRAEGSQADAEYGSKIFVVTDLNGNGREDAIVSTPGLDDPLGASNLGGVEALLVESATPGAFGGLELHVGVGPFDRTAPGLPGLQRGPLAQILQVPTGPDGRILQLDLRSVDGSLVGNPIILLGQLESTYPASPFSGQPLGPLLPTVFLDPLNPATHLIPPPWVLPGFGPSIAPGGAPLTFLLPAVPAEAVTLQGFTLLSGSPFYDTSPPVLVDLR